MRHRITLGGTAVLAAALLVATSASATDRTHAPTLLGRAVLPVATYAPGPTSGVAVAPGANGYVLPTIDKQPVEGFSAVVEGRHDGEYLAMPDNGYGGYANSADFLIRAYYITPHFKTAAGGDGSVAVDTKHFISFRDPKGLFPYPLLLKGANPKRLFTGADIDPESLQRGTHGDLWMGDEFGPWLLHFSISGVLLDPPFAVPGIRSVNEQSIRGVTPPPATATLQNSRGFEAIAISTDGRYVYTALEGATEADKPVAPNRRHIFQFDTRREAFTGKQFEYKTQDPSYMVSDMAALDRTHLVLIERDGGKGATALFRRAYVIDLGTTDAAGFVAARQVVDLAAIADPNLVSLPAIHAGDIGLGNPFQVTCESIEAIHPLDGDRVLFGCDNNLPNVGRNPALADDNEFIVVHVPGLTADHDGDHH